MTIQGVSGGLAHAAGITLTVLRARPDLTFGAGDIDWAAPVLEGQAAAITVTLRNLGGAITNSFQVDWRTSPPGVGGSGWLSRTVNGMAADSSIPLTFTYIFTPAGDYDMWVEADALDSVQESDEGNNVSEPVTVTALSPVQRPCGPLSSLIIDEDTTWYSSVLYYEFTCDVVVTPGVTLTVQPGANVRFLAESSGAGKGLTVNGSLAAAGTAARPIEFTADTVPPPSGNYWRGIELGSGGQARLAYTTLRYGGRVSVGPKSASFYVPGDASAVLDHVTIADSQGHGVRANPSAGTTAFLTVTSSLLRQNGAGGSYSGIHADGGGAAGGVSQLTVSDTQFISNTSYAVYLYLKDTTLLGGNNSGSGNGKNGIALFGTLGQDTELPVNPGFPYILPAELRVNSGVTLTVLPNSVIKLESGARLDVWGELRAEGTAAQPVYFTSIKDDTVDGDTNNDGALTMPMPGDWRSLYVESGAMAHMAYTQLSYGGKASLGWEYASLYVPGGARAALDHATMRRSDGHGIRVNPASGTTAYLTVTHSLLQQNGSSLSYSGIHADGGGAGGGVSQVTISHTQFISNANYAVYLYLKNWTFAGGNNSGSGNGKNGIALYGNLGRNAELSVNPDFPYIILPTNLRVNSGVTWTLPADSVIKLDDGARLYVSGTLQVNGTQTQPVYFTSIRDDAVGGDTNNDGSATSPAAGNWMTMYIDAMGRANLTCAILRYGGRTGAGLSEANLYLASNAWSVLDNATVSMAQGDGIRLNPGGSATTVLTVTDSLVGNNGRHGIYTFASGSGNAARVNVTNSVIERNGQHGIYADGSPGSGHITLVNSTLRSNGAVNYAGLWVQVASNVSISNTGIYSNAYGVRNNASASTIQIADADIYSNTFGVWNNASANSISITHTNIYSNSSYGVYNSSVVLTIVATHNWWGDASGPYHSTSNPGGTGDQVSDRVTFTPWLTSPAATRSRTLVGK